MKADRPLCPVCEKGRLSPDIYGDEFAHRGRTIRVDGLESYVCDSCGADPIFEDQIRRNDRRVADARRRADGLLTGEEIKAIRKELGLTQQEASKVFGGGPNSFSKYERGDVIQSVAMDRLVQLVHLQPPLLALLRLFSGAKAKELSEFKYHASKKVCLNDDQYRSRGVEGNVTAVSDEAWTTRKIA